MIENAMIHIKGIIRISVMIIALIVCVFSSSASGKDKITMLVGQGDTYKVSCAISEILKIPRALKSCDFYFYTDEDVEKERVNLNIISQSRIIIVDIMYKELESFALKYTNFPRSRVYGVRQNSSGKTVNIIQDPAVFRYYSPAIKENIKNLLLFLLNRDLKVDVSYESPRAFPKMGIFHPRSKIIFSTFEEYISWYKKKGIYKPDALWVGIPDFSSYAFPGSTGPIVSFFIKKLEQASFNVLPVYSYPSYVAPENFFFNKEGKSRVGLIAALSFKFSPIVDKKTEDALMKLNVPILNPIRMAYHTIAQWERWPMGMSQFAVSSSLCMPEFNGLIEPTVVGGRVAIKDERTGRVVYRPQPINKNIEFFVTRIKAWRRLQLKKNKNKKIAIIYYNHTPGKQNVGASYMNVFRSLSVILKRMRMEGYTIKGDLPSEKEIKELVLKSGRNIGSWAPGELDDLIATGRVVQIPVSWYLKWLGETNSNYSKKVDKEWGRASCSTIMTKNGKIIIPIVRLGNIILLPQPSRGWGDDPMKLYHSTQLYPHHQYTAFYFWLKHDFKADAIVHFGKHGTHEWLPGKQTGLSQSCPPEVLLQDLPSIYPYIVDNIGEGMQAKRRGRGVIIDHLIPPLKKGGLYKEYRALAVIFDEYNDAMKRDESLAQKKQLRIIKMTKALGIDKDLQLKELNEDTLEKVEHYLIEIQEANVPYGLHTYGVSPSGEALEEFSALINERNKDLAIDKIRKRLLLCGKAEMVSLLNGLDGRYVCPGEGNDPLRNPEAIPTGRNFYGFAPSKIPSKDAYVLGKKSAIEMIKKYQRENGRYPDKIGIILWACETQRNEGINESTILYLLGMKPIWDQNDKVTGVFPITGKMLGRPRIDVHMQTSGLYRDSFPNMILLLDDAVRQAAKLTDFENFIARHSKRIKKFLIKKGYTNKLAERISTIRVFSEKPGSYGTKIESLISSSGLWESDEEIANVFMGMVSFGYGKDMWGKPLEELYKKNLEDIKITMHSSSSNLYGLMDNDDVFQYLGGLSMSVKSVSGNYPDVLISMQGDPDTAHIDDLEKVIGVELRSHYLNPKWIEGMKKENYAGAREMSKFVEYLWGWQVTTPFAVDDIKWEQVFEVYIEDKYDLEIADFFDEHNPWALQSISARMLEAVRNDYWEASEEIKKGLSKEYALSVIDRGIACCDHTCNNPALNQMVVNIISMYGLLSPELISEFKAVLSKAAGMNLEEAIEKRKELLERLIGKKEEMPEKKSSVTNKIDDTEYIEGYEMVEEKKEDTKLVSSGPEWVVIVIVLCIIGLLGFGWMRKR